MSEEAGGPEGVWGPGSLKDGEQLCLGLLVGRLSRVAWHEALVRIASCPTEL